MRRRGGDGLVPNEQRTLVGALALSKAGHGEFHGYLLAGELRRQDPDDRLMAYSTLYRCLQRLEQRGMVTSRWAHDDPSGGPPRRLFSLTGPGRQAVARLPSGSARWSIVPA